MALVASLPMLAKGGAWTACCWLVLLADVPYCTRVFCLSSFVCLCNCCHAIRTVPMVVPLDCSYACVIAVTQLLLYPLCTMCLLGLLVLVTVGLVFSRSCCVDFLLIRCGLAVMPPLVFEVFRTKFARPLGLIRGYLSLSSASVLHI